MYWSEGSWMSLARDAINAYKERTRVLEMQNLTDSQK